ncbi:MAG: WG repeat-containing protein [Alistipes sp.]|nr:WG repeat-containing protein [Alistipes sp.]
MFNKKYIKDESNYKVVKRNDKYGVIDHQGKILIEPVFDSIYINEDKGFINLELDGYGKSIWPLSRIQEL